MLRPYSPVKKKIVVMAEPRDKIDGKVFAMLRSKGKKKKKKSMMGCYSYYIHFACKTAWE